MPRYAARTVVSAEKTQGQARAIIERYGGDRVSFTWDDDDATETEYLIFRWRKRWYRFTVPHPPKGTAKTNGDNPPERTALTDPRDKDLFDRWKKGRSNYPFYRQQEIARRWRVLLDLLLTPLFKLSEEEPERAESLLLAHALLPGKRTVEEIFVTEVARAASANGVTEATFRLIDEDELIALGAGR